MSFKDHFSKQARYYNQFRPHYPKELFQWLASVTKDHDQAWDCATGNGQAALGLSEHFSRILATDASASQIENAFPHESVTYQVAPAEKAPLNNASVDLVTVAQALHWFDLDAFYAEARRVLKPGGVLAVWTYLLPQFNSGVDEVLPAFYEDLLGPFWPPQRRIVEQGYRTIPFPFKEIEAPMFQCELTWNFDHLLGYFGSWSAVQRYKDETGEDPVQHFANRFQKQWGDPHQERKVTFPVIVRAGV